MTLLEKVKNLCAENSITLAKLEKTLNFGNGTLSRWDDSSPSGEKLSKVAEYFNVSVDFLLNTEKNVDLDNIYFSLAKEAQKNGIDPEDIILAIETIKKIRGEK
ncbi:helix-turn-helix domain-containing protein [Anaerosacchariphilus polymeriproducens]|uniref:XRE family transcriptional regulator n=1 Tax=Anaerosacchariphilus polymeriproducens TaxID=1812858 RepID=A0A371AUE2_9FIRM|nr:helix-turn-helix transcriptional regulator [Anaerosacchariphilus polymeriproducens]RDU23185.1 XRE family transcriptional regulator [Anaerosacchariphilus polymeriproducens]